MLGTRHFLAAATIAAASYKTLSFVVLTGGLALKVLESGRKRLRARRAAHGAAAGYVGGSHSQEGSPRDSSRRFLR